MDFLQALFLGVLQGVTEWLPVSSSGHLALAQTYFGLSVPVSFDVMLHFATLLAVTAYFRNELLELVEKAFRGNVGYPLLLLAALVPTAVIGLALKPFFESMFTQPVLVAIALAITGVFLIVAERFSLSKSKPGLKSALAVGIAQGISVAPGISRSGSTVGTALLSGWNKEEAVRFSFILAIPAILGATVLEGAKAFSLAEVDLAVLAAAMLAAFIAGYWSIGLFMRFVRENKLSVFSWYCFALAAVVFAVELLA
ncbi:MAG: undecaprenyl-diphosphate phosphatase [Candidatus Micrarchaeota archaeon]